MKLIVVNKKKHHCLFALFFVILSVAATFPADAFNFVQEHNTSGIARDVCVVQDIAYIADGVEGLCILDISDPYAPIETGRLRTRRNTRVIEVVGGFAYMAIDTDGLTVIDISDSTNPLALGSNTTPSQPADMALAGDYAYVADRNLGLVIIDISETLTPMVVDTYPDTGALEAVAIAISGSTACIAVGTELHLLDIADPHATSFISSVEIGDTVIGVGVQGEYAYVVTYSGTFSVVDISDTSDPVVTNSLQIPRSFYLPGPELGLTDVVLHNGYAFVGDGTNSLAIIEINGPQNLRVVSRWATPGYVRGFDLAEPLAVIANYTEGIQIVDIGEFFTNIVLQEDWFFHAITDEYYGGFHSTVADKNLVVYRGRVNGVGDYEIQLWNAVNNTHIQISDNDTSYEYEPDIDDGQVAWRGVVDSVDTQGFIYFWDGTDVQVIAEYDKGPYDYYSGYPPSNHSLQPTISQGQVSWAIYDGNDYEIVFWDGDTITQLTYNDYDDYEPCIDHGDIIWIGHHTKQGTSGGKMDVYYWDGKSITGLLKDEWTDTSSLAYSIDVNNGIALLAKGTDGMVILDILNPDTITYLGAYNAGAGACYDVKTAGNYAFLAYGESGLRIVDISTPSVPVLSKTVLLQNPASLQLRGNYCFATGTAGEAAIVDISDPLNAYITDTVSLASECWGLDVSEDGTVIYLTSQAQGLTIIDASDTTDLQVTATIAPMPSATLWDCKIKGNYAFCSGNDSPGLYVFDISDINGPIQMAYVPVAAGADMGGASLTDVYILEDRCFVSNSDNGIEVFDISYAPEPVRLPDIYTGNTQIWGVQASKRYIYAGAHSSADLRSGFQVYEIQPYIERLTDSLRADQDVTISHGQATWSHYEVDRNYADIFIWDGIEEQQLTFANINEFEPYINNGRVIWQTQGVVEIFYWDGNTIEQVTDPSVDYQAHCTISDNRIPFFYWNEEDRNQLGVAIRLPFGINADYFSGNIRIRWSELKYPDPIYTIQFSQDLLAWDDIETRTYTEYDEDADPYIVQWTETTPTRSNQSIGFYRVMVERGL
jgi:hypothetical protein